MKTTVNVTMISIYMIITDLATTVLGKGPIECSFLEANEGHQCFGAVGQPLLFHLSNRADKTFQLIKNGNRLLRVSKNQIINLNKEDLNNQSKYFNNGTLNLCNAMKRHSGDYLLVEYGLDGKLLKNTTVHLEIQAPVSQPAVSQKCLSAEEREVSCSSGGDGVELILTLDGRLLKNNTDQSLSGSTAEQGESSVSNITINGQQSGNLTCRVENKVSTDETVIHLKSCKDFPSSFPVVTVAVIAGVSLLLLVALCVGMIYYHNKSRPRAVNEGNSEVIIYTDVGVIRNMGKKMTRLTSQSTIASTYAIIRYQPISESQSYPCLRPHI